MLEMNAVCIIIIVVAIIIVLVMSFLVLFKCGVCCKTHGGNVCCKTHRGSVCCKTYGGAIVIDGKESNTISEDNIDTFERLLGINDMRRKLKLIYANDDMHHAKSNMVHIMRRIQSVMNAGHDLFIAVKLHNGKTFAIQPRDIVYSIREEDLVVTIESRNICLCSIDLNERFQNHAHEGNYFTSFRYREGVSNFIDIRINNIQVGSEEMIYNNYRRHIVNPNNIEEYIELRGFTCPEIFGVDDRGRIEDGIDAKGDWMDCIKANNDDDEHGYDINDDLAYEIDSVYPAYFEIFATGRFKIVTKDNINQFKNLLALPETRKLNLLYNDDNYEDKIPDVIEKIIESLANNRDILIVVKANNRVFAIQLLNIWYAEKEDNGNSIRINSKLCLYSMDLNQKFEFKRDANTHYIETYLRIPNSKKKNYLAITIHDGNKKIYNNNGDQICNPDYVDKIFDMRNTSCREVFGINTKNYEIFGTNSESYLKEYVNGATTEDYPINVEIYEITDD